MPLARHFHPPPPSPKHNLSYFRSHDVKESVIFPYHVSLPPDGSQDHIFATEGFEDFTQTDEEIEAYQQAHVRIPEVDDELEE